MSKLLIAITTLSLATAAMGLRMASTELEATSATTFKSQEATSANAQPGSANPTTTVAPAEDGKVRWLTIEQAQAEVKKKPRKIFIDVYTDWCGWCKRMDKTTFAHPEVAKYLNENFYAVKMDAEQADNIIFKNQVYKFNTQANTHDLAIMFLQGQMSYPTTVYLDEKLDLIQPVPGYLDAKQFDALLHFFAENRYRTQSWDDYAKAYKGSF